MKLEKTLNTELDNEKAAESLIRSGWKEVEPETKLQDRVYDEMMSLVTPDYPIESVYNDLMHGGCQSGFIGSMIYYADTLKFYRVHKKAIAALLADALENSGIDSPAELFGDKWDKLDPLAADTNNQNLLAWFGFEETAVQLFG